MADDDRIREFLKLRKQVKDDPKRTAAVIRKWMASDVPAHKKPKRQVSIMVEEHTPIQKIWWWIVTLYYLMRDVDRAIERLQARQACAKGQCQLPGAKSDP